MRRIRIGIDVGGTFTDAVAIDEETFDLVGQVKVPTTHTAPEGVARGIIESLHRLLAETGIAPEEVRFLAHGTTQATNALLEGDVARVGILATGSGLEGRRATARPRWGTSSWRRGGGSGPCTPLPSPASSSRPWRSCAGRERR